MNNSTYPPVFALGCPRSGTTMLAGFFEPTPWGAGVETHYITKFRELAGKTDFQHSDQVERLMQHIVAQRPIMQWKINWEIPKFIAHHQPASYAALIDAIAMERAQKHGWSGWVDKTPAYSFDVAYLLNLFPRAKFVFIYRDGRDVAHSLLNRPWGPNNIWACAEYWRSCCRSLLDAQQIVPSNQLLVIHYEQLLASAREHAMEIYDFLSLNDSQDLASRVESSVRKDNGLKWKTTLTKSQIKCFESVAGDLLTQLNYPVSYPLAPPGSLTRLFYQAHDRAVWAKFMFQQNVIDGIRIKYFGAEPFNQ